MSNNTKNDAAARAAADAVRLRKLHHADAPLLLANAWDPISAAVVATQGASAIATTSGGVSWAHGRADGQHLDGHQAVEAIRAIVAAVAIPVSADIEAGYGRTPDEVTATVGAVIDAGAAGINLEDAPGDEGPLLDPVEQAQRIRAARDSGAHHGVEVVINARTDVFLAGGFPDALGEAIARAEQYAEAGADCLFAPALTDLATIAALVADCPLPVNVMVGPGAPTVTQLAEVGVRRISVGTAVAQAAYDVVRQAGDELLTRGTYTFLGSELSYGHLNGLAQSATAP